MSILFRDAFNRETVHFGNMLDNFFSPRLLKYGARWKKKKLEKSKFSLYQDIDNFFDKFPRYFITFFFFCSITPSGCVVRFPEYEMKEKKLISRVAVYFYSSLL